MQTQLSHHEAKGLFLRAVDDELADREEVRLFEHLDGCADCRTGYEKYSRAVLMLRRVEREKAPEALSTMILRRVRRRRLGARALALHHANYRVPVEAVIPVLLGALVAAFLVLAAP